MQRFIIFFILLLPCSLHAQELNRYMVFFTDKANNTYSLNAPLEFLSERAVSRRARQEILLTEADLPVSQPYVEAVEEQGAMVFYRSRWFNAVLVEASETTASQIKALPHVSEVAYIAPGAKLSLRKAASSRNYKERKSLRQLFSPPTSIQNELLGVPGMQQEGFTGEGIMIAVLDGGFSAVNELAYFDHLFEEGTLLAQHDFTTKTDDVFRYSSHGTKALSTIAAVDSSTFIGTAPEASFLLAVTEEVASEYVVEEYNWLLAAEWADSAGVDVITASLGYNTFDDPSMDYTYEDMDGLTTVSARAAQFASERGILVVTSAGNEGLGQWQYIVTPADADDILSVGAIDEDRELAGFSSTGPTADGRIKPEVVALGVRTIVADPAGGFTTGNGTSFAAPQIAGFAAAVWQAFPELSNLEIRELIMLSGNRASNPDPEYGWGIPHFPRILKAQPVEPVEEEVRIYPNPVSADQLFIQFLQSAGTGTTADLYSITGTRLMNRKKLNTVYTAGNTYTLPIAELQTGIYFLHLYQADKQYVFKILKY